MLDENSPLSRTALLDLVWSKPTTQVAKDFGVEPGAVLKACAKLGIPRPATGHWTKAAHGKAPPRPPLSEPTGVAPECITLREFRPRTRIPPRADSTIAGPTIEISAMPAKLHDAVQRTRTAYLGGDCDRTYGTLYPKQGQFHLRVSVTPKALSRCLSILNTLVWNLERNGFKFVLPDEKKEKETRIRLIYAKTSTEVEFFMKEEIQRRERPPTAEEKDRAFVINRWLYEPTGQLKLMISEFHPEGLRKCWGDGKYAKLEDKVGAAVTDFIRCAQGKHAWELEWKAQRERYRADERRRQDEEARRRAEAERRAALVTASRQWSDAGTLKAFRTECEARLRNSASDQTLSEAQQQWLRWVDQVIVELDPLTSRFLRELER